MYTISPVSFSQLPSDSATELMDLLLACRAALDRNLTAQEVRGIASGYFHGGPIAPTREAMIANSSLAGVWNEWERIQSEFLRAEEANPLVVGLGY